MSILVLTYDDAIIYSSDGCPIYGFYGRMKLQKFKRIACSIYTRTICKFNFFWNEVDQLSANCLIAQLWHI